MIGTVQARWRLKYLGRAIEDCVVLTDVWVKDDGRWQAIRRHSTPAPPGACSTLRENRMASAAEAGTGFAPGTRSRN